MSATLTEQDHEALELAAKMGGPRWKDGLRSAWEAGTLARLVGVDGPVDALQRLRTKRGFDLRAYRVSVRPVTEIDIRELEQRAGRAGDMGTVALCLRAQRGEQVARVAVERIIHKAQADAARSARMAAL